VIFLHHAISKKLHHSLICDFILFTLATCG